MRHRLWKILGELINWKIVSTNIFVLRMLFILRHGKLTLRKPWSFVAIEDIEGLGLKLNRTKVVLLKGLKSRSLQQHVIYIFIRYFHYKTVLEEFHSCRYDSTNVLT